MNNNIPYWIFYKKKDMSIYAFTDAKYIAVQFRKTRNMKLFKEKKFMLSIDEIRELIKYNMSSELDMYDGYTRMGATAVPFSIPLISRERQLILGVTSTILHERIYRYVWTNPQIYKNKYLDALTKLKYTSLHYSLQPNESDIDDDGLVVDDFKVIMTEYRDLFINKEGEDY